MKNNLYETRNLNKDQFDQSFGNIKLHPLMSHASDYKTGTWAGWRPRRATSGHRKNTPGGAYRRPGQPRIPRGFEFKRWLILVGGVKIKDV